MQFYPGEYLADTAHLTTEEHGAYLLLLFNYWQRGKALDNSNDRLASVTRLSNDRWNGVKGVLKEFFEVDGDTWIHKRIERDLEDFRASLEQKRNAGKASAEKRYGKTTSVERSLQHPLQQTLNDKTRQYKKRKEDIQASPKSIKHKHGQFQNVLLTDEEYARLSEKYQTDLPDMISHLSEYIKRTGKAASQDHNLVLQKWVLSAVLRERREGKSNHGSIADLPDLPPELAEELTNGRK